MAQRSEAGAALPDDQSLSPALMLDGHTSSRESDFFFWPLWVLTLTCTYLHLGTIKKKKSLKIKRKAKVASN